MYQKNEPFFDTGKILLFSCQNEAKTKIQPLPLTIKKSGETPDFLVD